MFQFKLFQAVSYLKPLCKAIISEIENLGDDAMYLIY